MLSKGYTCIYHFLVHKIYISIIVISTKFSFVRVVLQTAFSTVALAMTDPTHGRQVELHKKMHTTILKQPIISAI